MLVVDDDRVLADAVAITLQREGYQLILAYDGESALKRWVEDEPDLIVLDINLPIIDGFTVCKRIREQADTPILLLTVRSEENDIIFGLDLGADDYITKPFSLKQLVARAKTILRRHSQTSAPPIRQVGDLRFNPNQREVITAQGDPISLTLSRGDFLTI